MRMPTLIMLILAALAAPAPGQVPRARVVALPDAYAPDLAPGEVLVSGSVRDVVYTAYQAPSPQAAAPLAAPAPQSSCYSQSYSQSYSYRESVPMARAAPLPPAWAPTVLEPAYAVPSYRSGPGLFRNRERIDFRFRFRSRGRGVPASFGMPTTCANGVCW